jgi:hypothetical protein
LGFGRRRDFDHCTIFQKLKNPKSGFQDFWWLMALWNQVVHCRKPRLSVAKIPLFSSC